MSRPLALILSLLLAAPALATGVVEQLNCEPCPDAAAAVEAESTDAPPPKAVAGSAGVAAKAPTSNSGSSARRMRWHSLLPGMFK